MALKSESFAFGSFDNELSVKENMVGVAQLASASDCGSEGRGFESLYPPFYI